MSQLWEVHYKSPLYNVKMILTAQRDGEQQQIVTFKKHIANYFI